ncbi:MAG: DNA polymerase III subunit beta [Deltaproteobacteria bacterium]|nr:DNA polymerase III subunit beta [Deltaproteobacteria bacterium]
MEFSIKKEVLLKGLSRIQSIVEKRTTIPILSNVLIEGEEEKIFLTATDLEVGMKANYPASVKTPGKIALSAKKLYEIVRELPEKDICFKVLENFRMEIQCEKAVFKLAGLSPEQFPKFPEVERDSSFPIDGPNLKRMLEHTSFSMSSDDSKYNLNGIFFHSLKEEERTCLCLVATDGHRLALAKSLADIPDIEQLKKGVIFPRKGVMELRKIIEEAETDLILGFSDNNAALMANEATLIIRLVDGEFPEYQKVIPAVSEPSAIVPREDFLRLVRRVSTLASEKSRGVKISFFPGSMEVVSSNPEFGEARETMDLEYEGEETSIGFNARYLLDILNSQECEKIRFQMKDNLSPGLITPFENQDCLAVVMPMRL